MALTTTPNLGLKTHNTADYTTDKVRDILEETISSSSGNLIAIDNYAGTTNAKIGDTTTLNTTDKTSLTKAVNEVNTKVGTIANLNTTSKTDLVQAINENALKLKNITSIKSYSSIQNAIDSISEYTTLLIPDGIYNENVVTNKQNIGLKLSQNAYINGSISFIGNNFNKTNSINLTGTWTTFPVGTTTFSGDFSSFATNDKIVIETGVQDGLYNQCGIDFATVTSASGTQLVISTGTKYPYYNPTISKITNAVNIAGTISEDAYEISGDYTSLFSVGDIVRIENKDGTFGVENSNAYFEINKIKSITTSKITFENRFTHGFSNYWIAKLNMLNNITIDGGYIKHLTVKHSQNVSVTNLVSEQTTCQYVYDLTINNLDVENSNNPIALELTYMYNGVVSNVKSKGSVGITDNGNVKLMSLINTSITNIISLDTASTTQGVYPFFIDYYFTPYKCWNDKLTINNLSVSGNKGIATTDMWIIGVKKSTFSNFVMYYDLRFEKCKDCILTNLNGESKIILNIDDNCILSNLNFNMLDVTALTNSRINNGYISGINSTNNRALWLRNSVDVDVTGIKFPDNDCNNVYLQDVSNIYIDGCSDGTGTNYSVYLEGTNTGIKYGSNNFNKNVLHTSATATNLLVGIPRTTNMPMFYIGRNSYSNKGSITGDGTAYSCVFDGDAISFNINSCATVNGYTCPSNMGGKYRFDAQIGLTGLTSSSTIAELYIMKNSTKVQLDYQNISGATSDKYYLLKGNVILPVSSGDTITLYVKVSGGTKTVTWLYGDIGGHFSGEMLLG